MKILNMYIDLKLILAPVIYIALGIFVYELIKNIIKRSKLNSKNINTHNQHRINTIRMLLLNIIKYIIVIVVLLGILATYGVNVTSLVAGLGVTTAIVGLAFQDFAKDIIAGFSIITEAQYEVGDTIEVDGFMGEVVFLGLKTTQIRNYKGATKIIANHHMDKIINYSLHSSLAVVDISVDYKYDPEKIEAILLKLSDELEGKIPDAIGKLQVLGINELADSSIKYRVTLEVKAMQHYDAERIIKKEVKRAFDKENINIPFPQIEVHNGK